MRNVTRASAAILLFSLVVCAPPVAGQQKDKPKDAQKDKDKPKELDNTNIRLAWRIITAHLLSGNNNGFAMTCKEAGISSFNVEVKSSTGPSATTTVQCPSSYKGDDIVFDLPKGGKAPFTISATAAGKPKAKSERVRNVVAGDWVTLRIYMLGCDESCD